MSGLLFYVFKTTFDVPSDLHHTFIHKGVRVYDVIEQKIISLIKMEPPRAGVGGEQEEEDVPARISWSDQFHLFVAMGDRVRVCEVKTRSAADLASPRGRDLPQHMVEITASFQVGEGQIKYRVDQRGRT